MKTNRKKMVPNLDRNPDFKILPVTQLHFFNSGAPSENRSDTPVKLAVTHEVVRH
jgi:hypothetical protein